MAYGGSAVGPPAVALGGAPATRQVKPERECEMRIEVTPDSPLRLRLLTGTAEIFGTEIAHEIWLTFPPGSNSQMSCRQTIVFTWYIATVEMDGNTETDYTAEETPMISYVNVHAVLEGWRNRAKASPSDVDQGPRLTVVGPTDSGKSTLSRMLLGWAAKQGWKPTFVDMDIGQASITIPGCIAATPIEMSIDPVDGIPLEMPLVYFYGHTTPSVNADLYKVLVKELAQILEDSFLEMQNPEPQAW
ncbi:CLP-similar protein 3 [Actinidia rufa]|uniref:CLP-similar protein 3 n=1 Tax=Actinidia rufa TaxID=165716 RepID=A0A7J0H7S7_9ERIC|nr:CLP-similar protein 3 [Actinidia rufa]